jgi:hypothetical protein
MPDVVGKDQLTSTAGRLWLHCCVLDMEIAERNKNVIIDKKEV